jgi:hypothetical protein
MPARANEKVKLEYADFIAASIKAGNKRHNKAGFARKRGVSRQTLARWDKEEVVRLRVAAVTDPGSELDPEESDEWAKCAKDREYFIDTYCMMWEKETEVGGGDPIPFVLWDCQRKSLTEFERNRQVIVLKTRQLGESWTICAYSLHACLFRNNFHVYVRSIGLKEASEQHERFKFMYDNLPDWMQEKVRLGGKNLKRNDTLSQFSNGSSVHMLAASKKAGRGSAPSLIFWDEMAFDETADPHGWRSIKPAINGGGRVVIVSTSNGPNTLFTKVWNAAVKGENKFTPIFFPWDAHPDRDQKWYDTERASWEAEGDLEGFLQEYPSNPGEAFQASSRCPFDAERLKALQGGYVHPKKGEMEDGVFAEKVGGRLHIFQEPVKGVDYTMGVDPAMGLKQGDYTAMVVNRADTNEVVALYRGKLAPEVAASVVEDIARWYNEAFVGVEVTAGYGAIIVNDLKQTYDNLFMREQRDKPWDAPTMVLGWYTHSNSKRDIVKRIRQEMARPDKPLSIPSEIMGVELHTFEENENKSYGAPKGEHDDTVIALGISLCIRDTQSTVATQGFVPESPWPFSN